MILVLFRDFTSRRSQGTGLHYTPRCPDHGGGGSGPVGPGAASALHTERGTQSPPFTPFNPAPPCHQCVHHPTGSELPKGVFRAESDPSRVLISTRPRPEVARLTAPRPRCLRPRLPSPSAPRSGRWFAPGFWGRGRKPGDSGATPIRGDLAYVAP